MGQYQETLPTLVPSFEAPGSLYGNLSTAVDQSTIAGTNIGVPPNSSVSNQGSNTDSGVASKVGYGNTVGQMSPWSQPVFWLVVLMIVSLWMFAHVAHLEVRS